jgi:hypothetical protein
MLSSTLLSERKILVVTRWRIIRDVHNFNINMSSRTPRVSRVTGLESPSYTNFTIYVNRYLLTTQQTLYKFLFEYSACALGQTISFAPGRQQPRSEIL